MSDRRKSERTDAATGQPEVQRREGFRVKAPPGHPSVCIRQFGRRYPVLDVSVVGVVIAYDDTEDPLPKVGEIWRACALEIVRDRLVPVELRVRRTQPGDAAQKRLAHVGFSYADMPDEVERDLQALVLDIQWHRYD